MKKTKLLISAAMAWIGVAHADFNPVVLTPSSYTFDVVVESNVVQSLPDCITASVGGGTGKGDHTFFEQGLYARTGAYQYCGVPPHNSIFTDQGNPNCQYQMPPDYTVNNGLMIDSSVTSGTFLFNNPTTATNLSILGVGGSSGCTVNYTVSHQDGITTETGNFNPGDWFNGANAAWYCAGRVGTPGGGYDSITTGSTATAGAVGSNPRMYSHTITVSSASPVTSISFTYVSGGGHDCFFAVSYSASGGTWSPVAVTGFNEMLIEPAALPFPITASMDNGTNINPYNASEGGGPGNTWFEQGYIRGNTSVGLPPSGSVFASASQPTHYYQMGNYSANNGILIDTNHQIANITPANPTNYSAFAFLTAGGNIGGNNVMTNICILQHKDGVNETNLFFGYDWYNGSIPPAYISNGRVNMNDRSQNTINGGNPKLFESYFALNDIASPVTNIVVMFQPSGLSTSATTFIMAVSASAGGVAPLVTTGANPATQTWYPSQTATFSVQVSGTPPVTNTWLVQTGTDVNNNPIYTPLSNGTDANGSIISGADTTTLTISDLTLADGTNYEYIASNAIGSATSSPALLIMNTGTPVAPIIDAQFPTASFSVLANHNDVTTFSVTIDGSSSPTLYYQWYNGSTPIPGATGATYANVDTNPVTLYCVITNFVGAATSSPVSITIYSKPPLSTYQEAVFAYNPVSYWPLNETDGFIAFDYAGTNDGIYTGNYTLGNPGLPDTAGIGPNTSAGFDGSSAYVNIPVGNLNITGPITLIQWIQTPVGGDTGFTTSFGHTDQGWRLDVGSGQPHFADDGPDVVSPLLVNDGNWHQLVGVYDGVNQYLYVDGQPSGTPHTSTPGGSTDNVWIGGAPDYNGRFFSGNIAQVAVLPVALNASQVQAIYNSLDTPPSVTITPASPSVYAGSSITLSAQVTGTPATSFQWYYIDNSNNSNNIPGATTSTYTIANAQLSLSGYTYGVVAANAYGTGIASVVLAVQNGPAYLGGDIAPLSAEAFVGAPVTYTVNAQGSLPIYYQWTIDGTNVNGATNASFSFSTPCGTHSIAVSFTNAESAGVPVTSSVASLQGDSLPATITFNTDGTGWQLNTAGVGSVPTLTNDVLDLTDGQNSEASGAFYALAQYVGSFQASFTYTGIGGADGITFTVQNSGAGTNALGAAGGGLGLVGITNSVSFEINLYSSPGIGLGTNGTTGSYFPTGPVGVNFGDPINVNLGWANGILAVSLKDTDTGATYSTNYAVGSLNQFLGGSDLGYIGFTGGDGGVSSVQTISNFEFHSVIPPVALSVSPVTGNTFTISWPAANSSYVLQTTSSLSSPNWVTGPSPTLVGGNYQVTVNVNSSAHQFYRLVRVVCD